MFESSFFVSFELFNVIVVFTNSILARHTTHDMKVNNIEFSRPQIIQHEDSPPQHTQGNY